MVMEIAKLTNHFEITQNLAGDYEVPNYDLIRDTLQAYADNIDEVLVVTSDELSVDGAKRTKKELKDMKDAIELSFATFMKQIDNVTKARLELKRIFTKAEGNIDTKIKEAYEEWKKEALLEYGRIASFDVTVDMLDPKVFQRKQTKKSIFGSVSTGSITSTVASSSVDCSSCSWRSRSIRSRSMRSCCSFRSASLFSRSFCSSSALSTAFNTSFSSRLANKGINAS